MRKLLTLSLLVALISVNVFGQNKPVHLTVSDKSHAVAAQSIYSKIQARADTTLFANFLGCDSFIYVYNFDAKKPIDSGWVEGNNFLQQTDEAEYYPFGDFNILGQSVGIGFQWGEVHYKTTTNKITFSLIRADGPGGAPGTVITSKQVNISAFDTTFGAFNEVFWTAPVTNPGNCYMAITLPAAYTGGHFNLKPSASLFSSTFGLGGDPGCPRDASNNTAWAKYGGTWTSYTDFWEFSSFGGNDGSAALSLYSLFIQQTGCGPISVTPGAPSICKKKSVTLTASGSGVTAFTWAPSTGLNVTTGPTVSAKPTVTTTYTVSGNGGACSTTVTVTVLNTPTVTIAAGTCAAHAVPLTATASSGTDPLKYQWKLGGTNISGATKSTFSATVSGSYTCQVTDKTTNCKTTSAAKSVTVSCRLAESGGAFDANAYPNPFTSSLTVNISSNVSDAATVELMDFSGRTLKVYNNVAAGSPFVINENLSSGVYFVRVTQGESTKMIKVVKN